MSIAHNAPVETTAIANSGIRFCKKWADCSCDVSTDLACKCGDSCKCGSVLPATVNELMASSCGLSDCSCGANCKCGSACKWYVRSIPQPSVLSYLMHINIA